MLRIAIGAHRTGFLVVAVLGFALAFVEVVGFAAAAGHTAAERAAFGKQMAELAPQITYLVPLPVHPETLAGYVQWRTYGTLSIVFGFWALMAATGAIRNEEERGLLETWLASGVGRLQLVAARFSAFTTSAAAAVLVTALGTPAAAAAIGDKVGAAPLTQVSVALLGLTLACFGIGLLAAQLVATRRGAAALGGTTLLALFLVDSMSRVRPSVADWSWLSPFALYDRTTVVAPGGRFDVPATAALFVAATVIAALSAAGSGYATSARRSWAAAALGI